MAWDNSNIVEEIEQQHPELIVLDTYMQLLKESPVKYGIILLDILLILIVIYWYNKREVKAKKRKKAH